MPLPKNDQSKRRPRFVWVATFAAIGVALATCTTPTPYQPVTDRYGYSEQVIETGRYKVSFSGNSLTDRETVENYLLFRAAELTVQSGNDYFVVADRDTEERTTYRATPIGFPRSHFYYSFYYHYYPFYDPWGYGAGYDYTTRAITRYTATADIMTYKGEKPTTEASAYNAREVMTNLGPAIVRPEDLAG